MGTGGAQNYERKTKTVRSEEDGIYASDNVARRSETGVYILTKKFSKLIPCGHYFELLTVLCT